MKSTITFLVLATIAMHTENFYVMTITFILSILIFLKTIKTK